MTELGHTLSVERLAGKSVKTSIAQSLGARSNKRLILRVSLDTLKPTLQVYSPYHSLILETESLAEAVEAYNKEP